MARQQRRREACVGANASTAVAKLLARHCRLDHTGLRLLRAAVEKLALSARGYDRIRKVARTIADLAGADAIESDHIAEALQFRTTT